VFKNNTKKVAVFELLYLIISVAVIDVDVSECRESTLPINLPRTPHLPSHSATPSSAVPPNVLPVNQKSARLSLINKRSV